MGIILNYIFKKQDRRISVVIAWVKDLAWQVTSHVIETNDLEHSHTQHQPVYFHIFKLMVFWVVTPRSDVGYQGLRHIILYN